MLGRVGVMLLLILMIVLLLALFGVFLPGRIAGLEATIPVGE